MDYKKQIIEMLEKIDNIYFKIVGIIRGAADCCPALILRKELLWREKTLKVETSA